MKKMKYPELIASEKKQMLSVIIFTCLSVVVMARRMEMHVKLVLTALNGILTVPANRINLKL